MKRKGGERLPNHVIESPSQEIFKIQLDTTLCNLLSVNLSWQVGWTT